MVLPSLRFSGLAIRCLVAALPALVLVLFAGLIAFIGLFTGEGRREYVLELTAKLTELARVLMGPAFAPGADPPGVEVGPQDKTPRRPPARPLSEVDHPMTRRWTADDAQRRSTTNADHGLLHGVLAAHEYGRTAMLTDELTRSLFRFNQD